MKSLLSSTRLPTVQSALERAKAAISGALLWPMCLHPELKDQSPPGDWSNLKRLGLAFYLMLAWLWIVAGNALRVMLSPSGELRISDVVLGFLVAAIVCLLDLNLFVAGSHYAHGLAQVSRTGQFKLPLTWAAKVKAGALLAVRVGIAVATANVVATTVSLEIYYKEINAQITREHVRQNASIITGATRRVDEEIGNSDRRQQALSSAVAKLDEDIAQLGATILNPNVADPEMRSAIEGLARAQAAKAEAEGSVLEAKTAIADELDGTCRVARRGGSVRSCRPGEGPRYRAATQRLQAAEAQLRAATAAVASAEAKLASIRSGNAGEIERKTAVARSRMADLNRQRADSVRQLAEMAERHRARYSDRDRLVQEAVRNDPNYVPREEGLLTRLKALRELMNEPAVAAMVYLLDFLLVLLELAAVLGIMIAFTPSIYSLLVVERDIKRAVETARRLNEVMSVPGSPDRNPAPPLQPVGPTSTEGSAPGSGPLSDQSPESATSGLAPAKRHAPRWRPLIRSSGDEDLSGGGSAAPSGTPFPSPA
jgi:hypothetical protein